MGSSVTKPHERVLSATTLRTAIRIKCHAGVSHRTIAQLIACYVSAEAAADREDGRSRLPVELIHSDQRAAFLEALQRVPARRSFLMDRPALG